MKTVILYNIEITKAYQMREQGTRYGLEPWGDNTTYYEGTDDGGKEYALPDDGAVWELAYGYGGKEAGELCLWRNNERVSVVTHASGLPQVVYGDYNNMPVLRAVESVAA